MKPDRRVEYRFAAPADIPVLTTLRAAFLAEVAGADSTEPSLLAALTDFFACKIASGEFAAVLAVIDGAVIATSGLVWHEHPPSARNVSGREAYIMNMYTLPPWRGHGIAAELLRRLLAFVREKGCRKVSLHALPKAREIYVRSGFSAVTSEMRLEL